MEQEQALETCRYWQEPQAWYRTFEIAELRREAVREIMQSKTEISRDRLQRCSALLRLETDALDSVSDWVRQNRPDLIGELPILDWTATEREHIHDYCKAMQQLESGILCNQSDPIETGDGHEWHNDYFTVAEAARMREAVKLPHGASTMTQEIKKEIVNGRIQRDGSKPMRLRMDLFQEWNTSLRE